MKRILACIDASAYATSVVELTTWAAGRLSASVELLHVVQRKDAVAARHDLSGAIGLGVKSELLEELTRIDEAEGKLAIERGRILLNETARRLTEAGIAEVRKLHRHGGILETIIEREAEADLVVIGKRGSSSQFAKEHIGSEIERVVRASIKPVLIVSSKIREPRTVVVAFDGSAAASKALGFVASSPLFEGLAVHLVVAGPDDATHRGRLEQAAARMSDRAPAPVKFLGQGAADKVIADYMAGRPDGLLVMGAYGHSPLRALIVGSTTTAMVRTVHVPVLLVR
ncbi:universal stress protein [Rhodopseudomonas palustris]|uniref:universal stress protein n=1 Tax=Rhodopseudomonas palustris TaxID=1076 RepID=UPI00115DF530|nr:universal stress protein [Rhodopseudomonas palustris]QDL96852.1 universal stress protein [Rhodopseudomonas palustris]